MVGTVMLSMCLKAQFYSCVSAGTYCWKINYRSVDPSIPRLCLDPWPPTKRTAHNTLHVAVVQRLEGQKLVPPRTSLAPSAMGCFRRMGFLLGILRSRFFFADICIPVLGRVATPRHLVKAWVSWAAPAGWLMLGATADASVPSSRVAYHKDS